MTLSRRTLVRGSAWSVPAIAVAAAAPAVAVSRDTTGIWLAMSYYGHRPDIVNERDQEQGRPVCRTHFTNTVASTSVGRPQWDVGGTQDDGSVRLETSSRQGSLYLTNVDPSAKITKVAVTFAVRTMVRPDLSAESRMDEPVLSWVPTTTHDDTWTSPRYLGEVQVDGADFTVYPGTPYTPGGPVAMKTFGVDLDNPTTRFEPSKKEGEGLALFVQDNIGLTTVGSGTETVGRIYKDTECSACDYLLFSWTTLKITYTSDTVTTPRTLSAARGAVTLYQ